MFLYGSSPFVRKNRRKVSPTMDSPATSELPHRWNRWKILSRSKLRLMVAWCGQRQRRQSPLTWRTWLFVGVRVIVRWVTPVISQGSWSSSVQRAQSVNQQASRLPSIPVSGDAHHLRVCVFTQGNDDDAHPAMICGENNTTAVTMLTYAGAMKSGTKKRTRTDQHHQQTNTQTNLSLIHI